jgi:hypothetical protein
MGLLLATAPLITAATSAPPPTEGLAYVALGDSYAAGFGLAPTTGEPVRGAVNRLTTTRIASPGSLVCNSRM